MEVGTAVWLLTRDNGWSPAKIANKINYADEKRLVVRENETGEEYSFVYNSKDATALDDIQMMNSSEESEVENLINLTFLNEATILYCLELRYWDGHIYTFTGPILLAVNPFKQLDLYDEQTLETYYNYGLLKSRGLIDVTKQTPLPPHIFSIADMAFRDMLSTLQNDDDKAHPANQSILISGESGAGKTESTKILLRYLTTISGLGEGDDKGNSSTMDKVIESNPILEAFGNARTNRNDNSSRFGKFILLNFDSNGLLRGVMLQTYLLERVRLCAQQAGERNFHVFYQMALGGSPEEMKRWGMTSESIYYSYYVNQGKVFALERINDKADFLKMKHALNTLGFESAHQQLIFDTAAGLMHLGQVKFSADADGEGSVMSTEPTVRTELEHACGLLGLAPADFLKITTTRTSIVANEAIQSKLNASSAADARDALAKMIYSRMFDWIVSVLNAGLRPAASDHIAADIGILDVFGFECFQYNSLEQLCINYTNEALQQQFNNYVLQLEQQEYIAEGIQWSFIEYPNNQDCIDLIDEKGKGIFAMLDDECMLPKGSSEKLANRMYKAFSENVRYSATAAQRIRSEFTIEHYAGPVCYSTLTFVDKNKDELPKEAVDLFSGSSNALIKLLFPSSSISDSIKKTPSICSTFKGQLRKLIDKIQTTTPYYIRCLKSNDQNKPDFFNRVRTTEQLRYGGVLQAVKVARSGFPYKMFQVDFFARYRCIANPSSPKTAKLPRHIRGIPAPSAACKDLMETILDNTSVPRVGETNKAILRRHAAMLQWRANTATAIIKPETIQIGKSKVFLRKEPYDFLESRRVIRVTLASTRIQCCVRGKVKRQWFASARHAIKFLQMWFRKVIIRRRERERRRRAREAKLLVRLEAERKLEEARKETLAKATVVAQAAVSKAAVPVEDHAAITRMASIEEQISAGRGPLKATVAAMQYMGSNDRYEPEDEEAVSTPVKGAKGQAAVPNPLRASQHSAGVFKCVCIMNKFGVFCGNNCKCKKFGRQCGPRCRCVGSSGKCGCHPDYVPGELVDWSHPDTVKNATAKAIKEHLEGIQLSSFGSNIEIRNRIRDYYKIPLSVSLPSKPKVTPNAATLAARQRPQWR